MNRHGSGVQDRSEGRQGIGLGRPEAGGIVRTGYREKLDEGRLHTEDVPARVSAQDVERINVVL
jgi:hypothetical protein